MNGGMKNPYLLTLPQLITAKKKISQVAAFYDPQKYSLAGFDSVALDPTEFREQLRRNFNVQLTDSELGAIVFLFDQDGDGKVDSVEFVNEFLRLGNEEKNRIRFFQQQSKERIERIKQSIEKKREDKVEKLTAVKVATEWTEQDETNAIRKIAKIAFSYDSMKGGLEGFLECDNMTPPEFKEQLRRVFNVKLTPEETAALTNIFDKYNMGEVDCKEFVYQFFRIRRNEIDIHTARQTEKTREKNETEQMRQDDNITKYCAMRVARRTEATEEEKKSALDKIRQAALTYKQNPFINAIQKAFESEELTPTAFKEMLKNNFVIRLNSGELDAVVNLFDLNKDGNISCVEFMTTFFKIGLNERSRMFRSKRIKNERLKRAEEQRLREIEEAALAKTKTRVIYPVLPAFDDVFAQSTLAIPTPHASFTIETGDGGYEDDDEDYGGGQGRNHDPFNLTALTDTMNNTAANTGNSSYLTSPSNSVGSKTVSSHNTSSPMLAAVADVKPRSPSRKPRKMSTIDILSPDKFAAKLAHTSRSLVELYPRASTSTKDFIIALEEQERQLNALRLADIEQRGKNKQLPSFRPKTSDTIGTLSSSSSSINSNNNNNIPGSLRASVDASQGQSNHGGGDDSVHSGSTGGMTQARQKRRPSRKPSMDAYVTTTLSALSPTHNKILQAQLSQQENGTNSNNHNHGALNRSSTQSSGNYSQDDFTFTDTPLRNDTPVIGQDETPYVEVEATLPVMDFDRPRTVHSNVRPPSREKDGTSTNSNSNNNASNSNNTEIVQDGYNL